MGKRQRRRREYARHRGGHTRPTGLPRTPGGDPRGAPTGPAGPHTTPSVASLFAAAVYALAAEDERTAATLGDRLALQAVEDAASCIAELLCNHVDAAWEHGWQPADLDRYARRRLGRLEGSLLRHVIAADAPRYAALGQRVAPTWMAQVAAVAPEFDAGVAYPLRIGAAWTDVVDAAIGLAAWMLRLPTLPRLLEPPSAWREGLRVVPGEIPTGVLEKVRALLAKAETTTFDAEADAFTAKAQELMARHRIDRAVLSAGASDAPEPIGRRIAVDDPYADAKSLLLAGVSRANGCRAVWSRAFGFSTVFGYPDELAAVEELFTSLLIQATAALRREGTKRDSRGRSRTTRFRRSFLVAFAVRVTQRLQDAVAATVRQASDDAGTALVPVLAACEQATEAAARSVFPDSASFAPAATDGEGWYAGTLAGEQASLARGPQLST